MIYVYILLIFLFLILLIFFIPINVIIIYNNKVSLTITILGIKINLPFHKDKSKVKKSKNDSHSKNRSKKKLNNIFSFGQDIFKIGIKSLIHIIDGLTVKEIILNVKVVGQDAAHTSLLYGKLSSVIYPFCGILISKFNPKSYRIHVTPNFLDKNTTIYFKLHFYGKIFKVSKSLLYFVKEYNKIKNK